MSLKGVLVPRIKDLMTSPVITVGPETDLSEAVMLMNNHGIGSLVVVRGEDPLGIMTERDIMTKSIGCSITSSNLRVSDMMSTPIRTVMEDDVLEIAIKIMGEFRVRRLPVVNKKGDLVGIITSSDIVREMPNVVRLLTKVD